MIFMYPRNCTDFSNNGLGAVSPSSCIVSETLNGEWELTLVHPIDVDGKWTRLVEGAILKAPVPAAMTPRVSLISQSAGMDVYRVQTDVDEASVRGGTLRLRTGPGASYGVLKQYSHGTMVTLLDADNASWYEVIAPDGKRGYMDARFLVFDHTEGNVTAATGQVVQARQLREQPFRIYRVVPELAKVTVYARHIFYDLLDNMIREYKPSASLVGAAVVSGLSAACLSPHPFTFYSDLTSTAPEAKFVNTNPVNALIGTDGVAQKYAGELARDWYDVYMVGRVGRNTNVQVREKKNLTGVQYDVDESEAVTRIMPTGEDADGNLLYLPELYIDSPYLNAYASPKWYHLPVEDAREQTEGDELKTKEQCYTAMREAAQKALDSGCDLPTVTLKVDFINCANTEEYRDYAPLAEIYLGDSVQVIAPRIGVSVTLRMTQYAYDCLTEKYTSVVLGAPTDCVDGITISGGQIAAGTISGAKLALHSIGSGLLQSGSVGSLQIRTAAIRTAHIQEAAIVYAHISKALVDTLNANAINAATARINDLVAGDVTTDELYAGIAAIALAQLTTANIVEANIQWANIDHLAAEIARISKAQISTATINEANIDWAAITTLSAGFAAIANASIQTADIDWAHIKDMTTDTAIITRGVGGKLYIADLAVTEANVVSLTVGELIVKGEDGGFYAVNVDDDGNVVTSRKQVENADVGDASINAGEKLIEGTVTAGCLNVQEIFADSAVVRSLIAANLDVDALFAREATVSALNAADITGNEYLRLMVAGKADAEEVQTLGQRLSAAELKITDDAIVSAVTSSITYQHEKQQLYSDMDALLGYRVEIVAGTVFLTENVRSTTLSAQVWHGAENVTDAIPASRFQWRRQSEDGMADAVWDDAHQGLKSVLVSTADVLRQASFNCELLDG